MKVKYLEISAHPKAEPEEWGFVLSKTLSRLHGIFRSQDVRGAIDLPLATETSLGSKLRVFGREPVLNAVLNNTGIRELEQRKMIRLGSVEDIPEDARKIRLRRVRKRGENELLKKARKKRNHLLGKGVAPGQIASVQALKARMKIRERYPYFLIEKDGKKYSVFFRQELTDNDTAWDEEGFNSYGLSSDSRSYAFRF